MVLHRVSLRLLLKCCWYDFHFTGFGFDKVCETKSSCTGCGKGEGALHRTIITKHLQGKVLSSNLRKRRCLQAGVSDHTLSRHDFFHHWTVAYHCCDGFAAAREIMVSTPGLVDPCQNLCQFSPGHARLRGIPCSCWTRLL
jgi:hypothetical protein